MDIEKLSFRVKDEKNEDVIVQIDARLADMSQPIDESDKSEVIPLLISKNVLEKITNFYEQYNFSTEQLSKMAFEIKSDNLKENLGEKNYQYFSEYLESENSISVDKIKQLINACDQYNFKYLRDLCQTVLGTEFYCETSEEGLEAFKKKNNLPELNEDEIYQIISENKEAFDALHAQFVQYLNNVEEIKESDFAHDDVD